MQLDSENTLENFVSSGLDSPKGLLIVGDTLISVNNTSIKGFRLSDANPIMNIPISGSIFMNDVAYNGKGTLYLSDSEKDVIYRLKITDRTYSTLISSGIRITSYNVCYTKLLRNFVITLVSKVESEKL